MRLIPLRIKTIDELDLPAVLRKICTGKNGLVLVTGPTGSGKSTSLAAMVNEVNEKLPVHVITVEDPLEFVHQDKTPSSRNARWATTRCRSRTRCAGLCAKTRT